MISSYEEILTEDDYFERLNELREKLSQSTSDWGTRRLVETSFGFKVFVDLEKLEKLKQESAEAFDELIDIYKEMIEKGLAIEERSVSAPENQVSSNKSAKDFKAVIMERRTF